MAELTPSTLVEDRLHSPFQTPGLEVLRTGVLKVISGADTVDSRIRAVLLTTQRNDFRAVFADVMFIPERVLAEAIVKPRPVFAVDKDVSLLREAQILAQQELVPLGLSRSYLDLLDARRISPLPQYRVSAACATLVFAALLDPVV